MDRNVGHEALKPNPALRALEVVSLTKNSDATGDLGFMDR
jgi:hypothetical protein